MIAATFGRHSYYQNLVNHYDQPIKMIDASWGHETGLPTITNRMYWAMRGLGVKLNLPSFELIAHKDPTIFSQTIPIRDMDWASDLDVIHALTNYKIPGAKAKAIMKNSLSSERCKAIMFWSQAAKIGAENLLDFDIDHKSRVIYPASRTKYQKIPTDDIRILFVGRDWERKGGRAIERAITKLCNQYSDISFDIVSDYPIKHPKVRHYSNISQELLDTLFKRADIFLFPTICEIFGVVIVEALSYGLPVIATNEFAIRECIEDYKEGLLIRKRALWYEHNNFAPYRTINEAMQSFTNREEVHLSNDIITKIELLIEDESLRNELGRNAHITCEAKFSPASQRDNFREFVSLIEKG